MKKIQTVIAVILISVITTTATAQFAVNNVSKNQAESYNAVPDRTSSKAKSMAKLSKATSRAESNFQHTFKNESAEKWFVGPKVITAIFKKEDMLTTVVYDKKGRWLHTIKVYHENKMPYDVKSLIENSSYSDYDITLVKQIEENDVTFYVIDLKNNKKIKEVSVYNGDINELRSFKVEE